MKAERLVCVIRRFWPLVGGAERFMGDFAVEAHRQGRHTTVVTAQWENSWPRFFHYREIPVYRLRQIKLRFLGTFLYMMALRQWLRRQLQHCDLVFVSMLKHDAVATLWALEKRRPVVLIANGSGATGDCAWQKEALFGGWIRRVCARADAIIAPSREIQQELLASGYPRKRVFYLPHGVAIPPQPDSDARRQARENLGASHPRLRLRPDDLLAVYTGRLHPAKGLYELVDAWRQVVDRFPNLRLWLVGEGPIADELQQKIVARQLQHAVLLAGRFDDVSEILRAADLFVFPSHQEGMSLALMEAMAHGLPIVATDIPGNRELVKGDESALLVPVQAPQALATAVTRLIEHPEFAQRLGQAARTAAIRDHSLEDCVKKHLELFDELCARYGT